MDTDHPNNRKYVAVTNGTCKDCGHPYRRGDWIVRLALARFRHLECPIVPRFTTEDFGPSITREQMQAAYERFTNEEPE